MPQHRRGQPMKATHQLSTHYIRTITFTTEKVHWDENEVLNCISAISC